MKTEGLSDPNVGTLRWLSSIMETLDYELVPPSNKG